MKAPSAIKDKVQEYKKQQQNQQVQQNKQQTTPVQSGSKGNSQTVKQGKAQSYLSPCGKDPADQQTIKHRDPHRDGSR